MRLAKKIFDGVDTFTTYESPIGNLGIVTSSQGVRGILWSDEIGVYENYLSVGVNSDSEFTLLVKRQLTQFFSGERREFDIALDLVGTPFQLNAWRILRQIPCGETCSYSQQALAVGGMNFRRAVARANHCNPISIIVPCHRVVGKNGALTGYAGGIKAKQFLLELEQSTTALSDI